MHCYQHRTRRVQRSVLAVAGCICSCVCTGSCLADIDFDNAVETTAAGEVTRIARGDLEGDGDIDIVALIPDLNGKEGAIQAFINMGNDGDGNWNGLVAAMPVRLGPGEPTAIAVGLIDQPKNQLLDVAVSITNDVTGGFVLIMTGDGVGGFVVFQDIQFPTDRPRAVKLEHFNMDAFLDLAVALDNDDANEGVTTVFFGLKNGMFDIGNAAQAATGGLNPMAIEPECLLGRPSGPGRDIAGVNQEGLGPGPGPGSVFVLPNSEFGFGDAVVFEIGIGPTDLSVADLNADELLDIVASNFNDDTFSVLLNDPAGDFIDVGDAPIGAGPLSIEAVNLDGDSDADIALVVMDDALGRVLFVVENLVGDLVFAAPIVFIVNAEPNVVLSADLNGDGRHDLITGNLDDGGTGGSISVLINSPSVLWDQGNYAVGAGAFVDQEFDDFPDFDSYLVTDIDTGGDDWVIESVTTFFTNENAWADADITQGRLNIFPKTGDLPDNDADDPGAGKVVDITIIDLGDTIAITAADLSIELAAGEYWVGLTPLANFGQFGQEFHRGAPIIGVDTAWRNPGGGFANGGDWSTTGVLGDQWVGLFDAAISITGTIDKGGGDCPWDLDGGADVGTGDLILLLGSWGDPYGTADLIALLGAWGPCG